MKKKIGLISYVFLCTIIFFEKVSYGYLDPSAMTYLIQVSAAIFISIGSVIGIFIYKIRRFFKKKQKNKNNNEIQEIEDISKK